MINVFNRRELVITMSMDRQAQIRNILASNGIDYTVKTLNLQSASVLGSRRGAFGSYGVNQDYSYEYKIYVHKNDYEKAKHLAGV